MLYYSLSSSKSLSVDCGSIQLSSSAVTRPLAVSLPTKICWMSGCLPAATLLVPHHALVWPALQLLVMAL
jgi:hypothetical protein